VLAALSTAGYGGLVAAEYRPEGGTVDGLGWVPTA
jgi:hydroxypyruvate isomerase